MEFTGIVAVAALIGFVGWLIWLLRATSDVEEVIVEAKQQLPSSDELKKLKKSDLVSVASQNAIIVDPKKTKAVILEEIEKHR